MLGGEFGVHAQCLEGHRGARGRVPVDRERAEVVDVIGCAMLESRLPGVSNSTSTTARSEGASSTSSTNVSRS